MSFIEYGTGGKLIIGEGNLMELHPEFLRKNGKAEFVVLPYEEFLKLQELLEDAEDLLELRQAKKEETRKPTVPLAEVRRRFGLEP